MCWPSFNDFNKKLVRWRFIPGEIGAYNANRAFVRHVQFPIEDRLELIFNMLDDNPFGTSIHTFSILNFVHSGKAKKFKIDRFMKLYHKLWNSLPVGPCPVKYSRTSVFHLMQIEVSDGIA